MLLSVVLVCLLLVCALLFDVVVCLCVFVVLVRWPFVVVVWVRRRCSLVVDCCGLRCVCLLGGCRMSLSSLFVQRCSSLLVVFVAEVMY